MTNRKYWNFECRISKVPWKSFLFPLKSLYITKPLVEGICFLIDNALQWYKIELSSIWATHRKIYFLKDSSRALWEKQTNKQKLACFWCVFNIYCFLQFCCCCCFCLFACLLETLWWFRMLTTSFWGLSELRKRKKNVDCLLYFYLHISISVLTWSPFPGYYNIWKFT